MADDFNNSNDEMDHIHEQNSEDMEHFDEEGQKKGGDLAEDEEDNFKIEVLSGPHDYQQQGGKNKTGRIAGPDANHKSENEDFPFERMSNFLFFCLFLHFMV